MATLEEIHREEIKMLEYLDTLCRKTGAHYSMIGGTMLGAIRHKGFIPWDDDIDVFMSLEDFEKIREKVNDPRYFLQTPESDIEMPFAMYKIRRNNSIMPEPGMESLKMHQGLWIDIFVYTNAGKTEWMKKLQSWVFLLLKTYRCRYLNAMDESKGLYRLLTGLPKKMQLGIDTVLVKAIQLLGTSASGEYFALDVGKYCVYPKHYFDELGYYAFEDCKFSGPKDYDGFLKMVFGEDYMIPRKWGHIPDYSYVSIE